MLNPARLSICLYFLLATGALFAQERHLYTLSLRHALPEQVLPALQSQLSADSSLSHYGQQLILNATAAEYRQVSTLLEQIDRAPRSLFISVHGQEQTLRQGSEYAINGRAGDGSVQVYNGDDGSTRWRETRVIVNQGSTQSNRDGTQRIRAVEGMAAFISSGNTYPLRSGPYGARELTPVTSGFYATARVLDGNQVVVDIDQQDQRLTHGGAIDTQALRTQVRGRLGEWITLGDIGANTANSSRGLASRASENTESLSGIAIRIDAAD